MFSSFKWAAMPDQWIPPPEPGHPLPPGLSQAECVAVYLDLLEAGEQMLVAGLRATLPPGADLAAAVRRCHDRQSEEHYQSLVRMAERFNELKGNHGGSRGSTGS
jgi:hypothetical protein